MVWGRISLVGKTELVILDEGSVTATSSVERVIRPHVIPFSQREGAGFVLISCINTRPHTAHITQRALSEANITVLPWPAMNPDLNPIEHLWDQLKRSLEDSQVNSRQELVKSVGNEYRNKMLPMSLKVYQIGSESAYGVEEAPLATKHNIAQIISEKIVID